MTVSSQPDGVSAQDDLVSASPGTNLTIDVLANDVSPDGDLLSVLSVTSAAHGTATVLPDQSGVAYQADAVFTGEDTFTYTMSAGGTPATGTVTVVCAAGPVPLIARASTAPGPGLTVRFAGMAVGGGGAGTDVYEDDFSTNSTARYTWEATGSHTWDADNQWIRILTGDNVSQTVSLDLGLPTEGYARVDMIKRADYPTDNSQSLRLGRMARTRTCFRGAGRGTRARA